ncbi:hypothetical protein CCR80_05285 [Rhodothalassium salexigens]|uniref:hypothetical protein n=1 Tax=Rhodothalassium salexigens TaxID=1086 RepID=UPI001913B2B2|nr:hypothetical protein [Rhodothalassium salexigens]MBK5920453.1 hypothetical protein [Rhodothalassium salexigens]
MRRIVARSPIKASAFVAVLLATAAASAGQPSGGTDDFDPYTRFMNRLLGAPDAELSAAAADPERTDQADHDEPDDAAAWPKGPPALASLNATRAALHALYREQDQRQAALEAVRSKFAASGSQADVALVRAHEARLRALSHEIHALKTAAAAIREVRRAVADHERRGCSDDDNRRPDPSSGGDNGAEGSAP